VIKTNFGHEYSLKEKESFGGDGREDLSRSNPGPVRARQAFYH
jgi:hypothetical protein